MNVLEKGLMVKDRITLYDIDRVFDLYTKGVQAEKYAVEIRRKSRLECLRFLTRAKQYFAEIIKILTNCKKVKRKHYRHLKEIFQYAGLLNQDKTGKTQDAKNDLLKVISWIGARLNKVPHEVAKNSTSEEVKCISEEIIKRDLEKTIMLVKAYHNPKDAIKEIKRAFNKIKDNRLIGNNKELKKQRVSHKKMFNTMFMENYRN